MDKNCILGNYNEETAILLHGDLIVVLRTSSGGFPYSWEYPPDERKVEVVFSGSVEKFRKQAASKTYLHEFTIEAINNKLVDSYGVKREMLELLKEREEAFQLFIQNGETDEAWETFREVRNNITQKLAEMGYNGSQLQKKRIEGLLEDMCSG
jgi:hypothetical protein